jgi:hypothetical protein
MPRKKSTPTHSVGRILDEKVLNFIESSNYKNKEHLIIICSLIEDYTIIAQNFKNLPKTRFVNISNKTFEELIKDCDYILKAKNFLLDKKVIDCDYKSMTNEKAFGYRINENYLSLPTVYFLQKNTLIKNIINKRNRDYSVLPTQYHTARNNFMKIKIDYTRANEYTNSLYLRDIQNEDYKIVTNRYKYYFSSILKIQNGDLYFRQNRTNRRIDNNLTNLPTELRQFIINDEVLYNLDCANSQPFLFAAVLIENGIVDENYNREATNGTIYEYYANSYNSLYQTDISRNDAKLIIMKVLFSKNEIYKNEKDVFRLIFPNAYDFIYNRKMIDYKLLSNELQKLESSVIIDDMTQKLESLNINYYTIHDSIVVSEKNIEETMKIMLDTFLEKYNITPKIKKERL